MTHKERILKAARGEMPDLLPYIPRIDLWYAANSRAGTLPRQHQGRTAYEISRAEGWGLMTASIDFTYQFLPEALLHRAIGTYSLKEHVFKFVFSPKIDIRVKEEGERTFIQYHTPKGMVSTCKVYSEEMKRGGVSIPWIEEHIIKKAEDYRIVACLFENLDLVPHYHPFLRWEKEVGEDGLCAAWFAGAASPMHHIQKYFLDATEFFFHYHDYQKEMRALAEAMNPLYEKALKLIAESPALAVNWGGNYDEMITYPPYFEKELLPWIQKASAAMGAKGKFVFCHCDGENEGLLDLIRDSGMHVAESVCPHPMTKVKIEEYYRRWSERLTICGGVPSNILLPSSATDDEFQAFLPAHRGLTEHGTDVQHTQAPYLEEVTQQFRAAAFQRIRRDAVQLDDVVGDQAVAARDQLKAEFAFAHRALAGDHHADAEHVEEHAVARGRFGQFLGEVVADQPHQVHAGFGRLEQRDARAVGEGDQFGRDIPGACHDQAGGAALLDLTEGIG